MANQLMLVTGTHPDTYTVDLLDWRSGWQCSGVPVMTGPATGRTGTCDLPVFTDDAPGVAIVDIIDGAPLVLGFLHNRISAMRFDDGRMVYRHDSDVYFTLDRDGNAEYAHPSGTYVRIAESPDHQDLSGLDHDEQWKIERNTDKSVTLRAAVVSGGTEQVSTTLRPDGHITVKNQAATLDMTTSQIKLSIGSSSITLTTDGIVIETPSLDINKA